MRAIGIDTGGTFTDTVVITEGRGPVVGKAPSTQPEFEQGVIDSLTAAAEASGLGLRALLESTTVVAHGTTVALNALLTGTGAKVGLLVTEGFEATLPLARANKLFGLPPGEITNALRWRKPDLLVPRRRILGVPERIDAAGRVIVPLSEERARQAIVALRDQDVDAIGICLLWSTVEPRHEQQLLAWAQELVPGATVTLSSDLAPRLGEYERTSSVVVNSYVAPLVSRYLEKLRARLHGEGFRGRLMAVTMGGGVLPLETAMSRPIHILHSGPAAGLEASRQLGEELGHPNVIATDVGGTSFDVGLVVEGELPLSKQPMIERQALAVPLVEVNSIGTGGGSIAWLDELDSVLHVGPASAGSRPGPACYGRGGQLPTLTDAAVVLGYIDRLGGRLELDSRAAHIAIGEHIAQPLGVDVTTAAAGIYEVAVAQMADLVRQSTIRRGHDPTHFWLYAYGGAAPQYAGRYAADLGTAGVVIPHLAPEFSAQGAATSDSRMRLEREVAPCAV
jgi:N-methylhydantoinase A